MKIKLWEPWLIWAVFAIGVPVAIFIIWGNGDSIDWIGFWAGYAGAILGSSASLIAFYITYRQNESQHEATRKEIQEQNRLQVLPVISVSINDANYLEIEEHDVYYLNLENEEFGIGNIRDLLFFNDPITKVGNSHFQLFTITNIGVSALLGASLLYKESKKDINGLGSLGALQKGEEIRVYYLFPFEPKYKKYDFAIKFCDIYGNAYEQFFSYDFQPSGDKTTKIRITMPSSPKLINKENWGQFEP